MVIVCSFWSLAFFVNALVIPEIHQRENESLKKKLLLRGKIKKVFSRALVCSLEQRARNAHDQNEQTLPILMYILSIRKSISWQSGFHHTFYQLKFPHW